MAKSIDELKKMAAARAVEEVRSGMVVGLGHGSTALFAVRRLAELMDNGQLESITGVPCSLFIQAEAVRLGIPLANTTKMPAVDLTIDGADEVSADLDLIKGGGGALLREKIVAQASRREVIIVDESKLSERLGEKWAVPVEVMTFGRDRQVEFLEKLGAGVSLRLTDQGQPFVTDQGNNILDADFGPMDNPRQLAFEMNNRVGIVEHGLFLGMADLVVAAGHDGVRVLKR